MAIVDRVKEGVHASFVDMVPFKSITMFTLFQLAYFMLCFGVTWIPIAGILFPLPFFILIGIRQYILPKFFDSHHLRELDAAEYEEVAVALTAHPLGLSSKVCDLCQCAISMVLFTFIMCSLY